MNLYKITYNCTPWNGQVYSSTYESISKHDLHKDYIDCIKYSGYIFTKNEKYTVIVNINSKKLFENTKRVIILDLLIPTLNKIQTQIKRDKLIDILI